MVIRLSSPQPYLQGIISIHHPAVCPGRYYQKPSREKSKNAAHILEEKLHASRCSAHPGQCEQECPASFLKPGQRQGLSVPDDQHPLPVTMKGSTSSPVQVPSGSDGCRGRAHLPGVRRRVRAPTGAAAANPPRSAAALVMPD